MPGGDPLVAEVAVDLVDPGDAAHQKPLEVELRRDAQIEIDVERVVMGLERPGRGAARDHLHHRRLDLQEAAGVEKLADSLDDACPHLEHPARLLVGGEVEVALAVAGLDVGQAVPLLGQRPHRLREHLEVVHLERQLPRAGAHQRAGGAHDIAEVEALDHLLARLGQVGQADEELQLLPAVVDVGEDELPLAADRAHAAGHAELETQRLQLLGRLLSVLLADPGGLQVPIEAVRIGADPRLHEPLALLAPVLDLFVELGHGGDDNVSRAGLHTGASHLLRVRGSERLGRAGRAG